MAKNYLDKYYTPSHVAEHCVQKTLEVLGPGSVTEFLEPSAGSGVWLPFFNKPFLAFDIQPESSQVMRQDFLQLLLPHKPGRCVIGNPPFGMRNHTSIQFFKKAIHLGDSIAFIQPAGQFRNNQQMYEFDLVHSEMLPMMEFSGKKLLCCFNIYKRPAAGINRKAVDYSLQDVQVIDWRRNGSGTVPPVFHYAFCAWGTSIGKRIRRPGQYATEIYLTVKVPQLVKPVVQAMAQADWLQLYPSISTPRVAKWKVCKYLRDTVPGIK